MENKITVKLGMIHLKDLDINYDGAPLTRKRVLSMKRTELGLLQQTVASLGAEIDIDSDEQDDFEKERNTG